MFEAELEPDSQDILTRVREALRGAGLHDFDVNSIRLFVRKRGPKCPPGTTASWERIDHPDGSVSYQWVCK